jgi:hypothetical protein
LENKAGILIAILGVIFIIPTFNLNIATSILPFYSFFVISLFFSFLTIVLSRYKRPHKPYEDFYQYTKMDEKDVKDQLLLNYIVAIENLEKKNNKKVIFLSLSFISILIGSLFIFGKMIYAIFF